MTYRLSILKFDRVLLIIPDIGIRSVQHRFEIYHSI